MTDEDEAPGPTDAELSGTKPSGAEPTANAPAYEIGYGRPPVATRFQPKRSGNPNGRPRGSGRRKLSMAQAALDRKVPVGQGEKTRKSSVRQVAFQKIGDKALSGDVRSMNFLLTRENKEQPTNLDECPVPRETALELLRSYFIREKEEQEFSNEFDPPDRKPGEN